MTSALLLLTTRLDVAVLIMAAFLPMLLGLTFTTRLAVGGLITASAASGMFVIAASGVLPVSPVAYGPMVLSQSVWYALPGLLAVWTSRRAGRIWALLSVPVSWTAVEFASSNVAWWGHWADPVSLGYAAYGSPLIQASWWSGINGVTLLVLGLDTALVLFWMLQRFWVVGVFAGLLLVGALPSVLPVPKPQASYRALVVQGGITSLEGLAYRFDDEAQSQVYATYKRLTDQALKQQPADLVIWPEGTLPVDQVGSKANRRLASALPTEMPLLVGGYLREGGNYFNAALLWEGGRLTGSYRKQLTVPFSEDRFTPAPPQRPLSVKGSKIGVLICFESAFPELARQGVRSGARALVVVTNDTWAGQTNLSTWHLRASAVRAIETRRFVVLASQSGRSALISPSGQVLAESRLLGQDVLGGTVRERSDVTPFVRYGNWVGLSAFVLCLIVTVQLLLIALRGHFRRSTGTIAGQCSVP